MRNHGHTPFHEGRAARSWQVSWLPDRPGQLLPASEDAVGRAGQSPVTVAGPRRICTGFPLHPSPIRIGTDTWTRRGLEVGAGSTRGRGALGVSPMKSAFRHHAAAMEAFAGHNRRRRKSTLYLGDHRSLSTPARWPHVGRMHAARSAVTLHAGRYTHRCLPTTERCFAMSVLSKADHLLGMGKRW